MKNSQVNPEQPTGLPVKSKAKRNVIAALAIVLITLFFYIPAMQARYIWDDNLLLTHNLLMHDTQKGLARIWGLYVERDKESGRLQIKTGLRGSQDTEPLMGMPDYYPLTWSVLWLEARLWGFDNPAGYHVVNVVLHAIGSVLVWVTLGRLKVPGAWLAAAIFAVHPVNVASVAWIVELKNVISTIFFLLTIYFYSRLVEPQSIPAKKWLWCVLMTLMFLLGLISKASVVMLPVILLGVVWWLRDKIRIRDVLILLPFFVLSAAASYLANVTQQAHAIVTEQVRMEGEEGLWRLAMSGSVPWFYLYKALLPFRLLMIYPRWSIDSSNPLWYLPGIAIVVLTAGLVAAVFVYKKSWAKPALFASGYFLVNLFPVMGFFDMYYMVHSLVADHWQQVAIIAPIALVTGVCWRLASRLNPIWRRLAAVASVGIVAGLGFLSWNSMQHYQDQYSLWMYNLAANPKAWMGQYNLGTDLAHKAIAALNPNERQRLFQRSEEHLRQAIKIRPTYSAAYTNLAVTLMNVGRPEEALPLYQQALKIDPESIQAYYNLALTYAKMGKPQLSIEPLTRALEIAPDYLEVRNQLALSQAVIGQIDPALETLDKLIKTEPKFLLAYVNRAKILGNAGKVDAAIEDVKRALEIQPNYSDALLLYGTLLQLKGQYAQASSYFLKTLARDPFSAVAHFRYASAQVSLGNTAEALKHFEAALAIDANMFEARANIALLLSRMGQVAPAVEQYRQTLRQKPDMVPVLTDFALLLAGTPDPKYRNPAEAIELASKACELTEYSQLGPIEVLAQVQGEAGQFDRAAATARRALELAIRSGTAQDVERIEKQLGLFRAGKTPRFP